MKLELEKLAKSLGLPTDTLDRWIRQGRIPVTKSEGLCDFKKKNLTDWAIRHQISLKLDTAPDTVPSPLSHGEGPLLAALMRGGIHYGVRGNTVEEVLETSVNRISWLNDERKAELFTKLIERENLSSTGIGRGVAIPHPRNPLSGTLLNDAAITTCFLEKAIDFNAIDRMPVHVVFMMVCPDVKKHLTLLSRISFCLRDEGFVELLNGSPSEHLLFDAVKEREERLDAGGR